MKSVSIFAGIFVAAASFTSMASANTMVTVQGSAASAQSPADAGCLTRAGVGITNTCNRLVSVAIGLPYIGVDTSVMSAYFDGRNNGGTTLCVLADYQFNGTFITSNLASTNVVGQFDLPTSIAAPPQFAYIYLGCNLSAGSSLLGAVIY